MSIPAKYVNGVFRPLLTDLHLEDGTVVDVYLRGELGERGSRGKLASVTELGVFGMWKDRDDIGTGVDYVNRLRDNPRGR